MYEQKIGQFFFSLPIIKKQRKKKMTTNIRFTQDGEILGLARAPTIKFKFFGKFENFDLLQLVIEHSAQRTMTLKKGARVKQLSETQVERVLSWFLKYRNRRSAESLTEQYFYPQIGVPKLQEAIISRNASHFVFASETFASEQKTEEFLDVYRFSDFYQSLRFRIY
jgi:hypothetical protein